MRTRDTIARGAPVILSVLIFLLPEVKRSLLGAMLTIVYVGLILVSLDASR